MRIMHENIIKRRGRRKPPCSLIPTKSPRPVHIAPTADSAADMKWTTKPKKTRRLKVLPAFNDKFEVAMDYRTYSLEDKLQKYDGKVTRESQTGASNVPYR